MLIFQKQGPAVPDGTLIRERWNKEGTFDTPPAPTGCSAWRRKQFLQQNSPFPAHPPPAPARGELVVTKLRLSQHLALVVQLTWFFQQKPTRKAQGTGRAPVAPAPARGRADTQWKPRQDAWQREMPWLRAFPSALLLNRRR